MQQREENNRQIICQFLIDNFLIENRHKLTSVEIASSVKVSERTVNKICQNMHSVRVVCT